MKRRPVVYGNWKMNKTVQDAGAFALELKKHLPDLGGVDIGIAAAGPLLPALSDKLKGTHAVVLGQNLHWEESGAFTGEVSTSMLKSAGCRGVLIGHSERRQYFGETDETVAQKLRRALADDLQPVVCVGESLEQRKSGDMSEVVSTQIKGAFAAVKPEQIAHCIIAYEPVWAIGTGETATPEQAQEVHALIRGLVGELSAPHIAERVRIQYGGSVKPTNAAELMSMEDIDGALVGGASLTVDSLIEICQKSL